MNKKDNKGFWDRWAGRYDRFMSGDKDTYARILNRMKKKLNRNMVVLELACGTGILSVQLAGNVSRKRVRTDKDTVHGAFRVSGIP